MSSYLVVGGKCFLASLIFLSSHAFCKTWTVTNGEELQNALMAVSNNDTVLLEPGTYRFITYTPNVYTLSKSNGGKEQHINPYFAVIGKSNVTVKAANPDKKPRLQCKGYQDPAYVFYAQKADNLHVENLIFEYCNKGVVVDRSDHVKFYNNVIREIGWEALHLRDGSDNNHIKGNKIYRVGMTRADRGESIYVGSDKKAWHPKYTAKTKDKKPVFLGSNDHTVIEQNELGPDIGAELDIKEGVSGTIVKYNTFYGAIYHTALLESKDKRPRALLHDKGAYTIAHHNSFDVSGMIWDKNIVDNKKHRGAIRVEQILKETRGEKGWDVYGHNGAYVYNVLVNDNELEKIVYIPTDGGQDAKVGCNKNESGPTYHSGPKSGVDLETPKKNDIISDSTCDSLVKDTQIVDNKLAAN